MDPVAGSNPTKRARKKIKKDIERTTMNRNDAKEIAETITNQQIADMLKAAKEGIQDWTKRSSCNSSMTKGLAWNILAKNFDVNKDYHSIAKKNMIWEFGDFLPENLKPTKVKKNLPIPVHQDPEF